VTDRTEVADHAEVTGHTEVADHAEVTGHAEVASPASGRASGPAGDR